MTFRMSTRLVGAPNTGTSADIRRFRTRVRVPSEASGGAACVLEHVLAPGCVALPMHRHAAAEVLHVLAGTLRVEIDNDSHVAAAGSSVVIPPGAWHTVWTDPEDTAPARFLAVCAPGGMDAYYADVARHVPPPGAGVPDMEGISLVGERHGVEADLMSLYDLIERHGVELS